MKKDIHPDYHIDRRQDDRRHRVPDPHHLGQGRRHLTLDIDPTVHPAWTGGSSRLMDAGGRVSKFKNKYAGLGF